MTRVILLMGDKAQIHTEDHLIQKLCSSNMLIFLIGTISAQTLQASMVPGFDVKSTCLLGKLTTLDTTNLGLGPWWVPRRPHRSARVVSSSE